MLNRIIMKKLCLLGLLIIIGATTLSAQEKENIVQPKHAVGLAAGFSTGYGLSYRYWPVKYGLQVTTAPFFSNDEYHISLGVTGLYKLRSAKYYNFYMYYSNHFLFEKSPTYYALMGSNDYSTVEYDRDFTWITGAGPGFEIIAWGRLGFNGMFGLAYYHRDKSDWQVSMTIESGIFFKL